MPDREEGDKSKTPPLSRLQQIRKDQRDDKYQPDMPQVECTYLLDFLWEVGPVSHGAVSDIPLTHLELEAWQRNTGLSLTPWEVRTLHRLSRCYVAEVQAATDPKRPAPWKESEDVKAAPNRRALALRDHIRGLAKL